MTDEEFVYVVTRDGKRVNYENYKTYKDALPEAKYWTSLIHKIVNGNKVDPESIVRIRKTTTPKRFR
jgi:hypothetical protein